MSSETRDEGYGPPPELRDRLGYLLKHVWLRLVEENTAALAPHGVDGRELAVLLVLDACESASQLEAARRLDIDRTTMVALVDALEDKGLVTRRRPAVDRRRNVVELTAAGRDTLRDATRASQEAERRFLASLDKPAAREFKEALQRLLAAPS